MNALLARVGGGLFQQAFVVADFDGAQRSMRATLGCGEFVTLPATDIEYDFRGGRTTCAIEIGFARSGNVQVELLRPVHDCIRSSSRRTVRALTTSVSSSTISTWR